MGGRGGQGLPFLGSHPPASVLTTTHLAFCLVLQAVTLSRASGHPQPPAHSRLDTWIQDDSGVAWGAGVRRPPNSRPSFWSRRGGGRRADTRDMAVPGYLVSPRHGAGELALPEAGQVWEGQERWSPIQGEARDQRLEGRKGFETPTATEGAQRAGIARETRAWSI